MFTLIKNSTSIFKTYLKRSPLAFSHKYKKCFVWENAFSCNYKKSFLFGKNILLDIITLYIITLLGITTLYTIYTITHPSFHELSL